MFMHYGVISFLACTNLSEFAIIEAIKVTSNFYIFV